MTNQTTAVEVPYSRIRDLIQCAEQRGSRLACTFACPVTGKVASVTIDIVKANDSFQTKAKTEIRNSAIKSISRTVGRTLRGLFGNNVVGRLANGLAKDQAKAVTSRGGFSEAELERAMVAAFAQVQSQFRWQEAEGRYVHASAAPDRN